MGYLLLKPNFEAVDVVEEFESIIWTERYWDAGDFELYLGLTQQAIDNYLEDYYLWSSESNHLMIVEDVEIEEDEEDGTYMTVTGRSIESILDRRIIWSQTNLTGNLQTAVKKILDENVLAPSDSNRQIPNIRFETSTDPQVTSKTVSAQLMGETVLEAISAICEVNDLGFKITLTDENEFVFALYSGIDRSYPQVINPRVTFSADFDNLGSSKYFKSKRNFKNTIRVAGEGEGLAQKFVTVNRGGTTTSGMARREAMTDGTASSNNGEITEAQYLALLQLDGARALGNSNAVSTFDGEIESTKSFVYLKDFQMGDIVQLEANYISEAQDRARVVEFIRSKSAAGNTAYPTLKSV